MGGRKTPLYLTILILALVIVAVQAIWLFWPSEAGEKTVRGDQPESSSLPDQKSTTTKYLESEVEPGETKTTNEAASRDFRVVDPGAFASIRDGRFFTTDLVEDLVPGDAQVQFSSGERVYVFAAIHAPIQETVKVSWYGPDGGIVLPSAYLDVKVNTGETGYRIYTYRTFKARGEYSVAVFNSNGSELGRYEFTVN